MTDDGLLSQDEIDALLSSMNSGGEASDSGKKKAPAKAEPGELDPESLRNLLRSMLSQASTVVGTVVNKAVDFPITQLSHANPDSLAGLAGGEYLCLQTSFESGLEGELYYIISKKDTAVLADLMMMGDGSAEYEDDHKDALTELGNQIMGAISTALGTEYQITVSSSQGVTREFDPGDVGMELADAIQADVDLQIEGFESRPMIVLVSGRLTEKLLANDGAGDNSSRAPEETQEEASADFGLMGGFDSPGMSLDGDSHRRLSGAAANVPPEKLQLLLDIPLNVSIELGRTRMSIRKILELGPGSIIELDRMAGEPVDLLVNNKVVAKGEVVVIDEYFGIRIISLVSPEERLKQLR